MKRNLIWLGVIAMIAASCASNAERHGDMRISADRYNEVSKNPDDILKSEAKATQFTPLVSQKQIKPGPLWTYYENTGALTVDISFKHEGVSYSFFLAAVKSPEPGDVSGENVYGNADIGSDPEYDIQNGYFSISDLDENNNRISGSFSFWLYNEENSPVAVSGNFMENDFKTLNTE